MILPLQESAGSFEVVVVASMPQEQVQYYGAPAQIWYNIRSPGEGKRLLMDVLWVNKTATRLPEVLSCLCTFPTRVSSCAEISACWYAARYMKSSLRCCCPSPFYLILGVGVQKTKPACHAA